MVYELQRLIEKKNIKKHDIENAHYRLFSSLVASLAS